MVSKSIADLNNEANSLMENLSVQSSTFDTSALNNTLISFKQVYSDQMKAQIPEKIAEEVAADPVVSKWITSDEVELIASNYLNVLSNKAIIDQSSNDTLSNEISSRIRIQITGLNPSVSDDEMDAVLHRVDTDVRVGVAEGISVVVIENSETIDMYFNETNTVLQNMLNDAMNNATDDLSDAVSKQVAKRLKKTMGMVPAGLPVIPPHWVFTINVWTYDVVGKYQVFRVIDNDNEVIFDPYFGHVGQVYVREKETVYHPFKKNEYGLALKIGENEPILFNFNGYAATVVGTGPKGVGDKTGGRTEESEGYTDLLNEFGG